MLPALRGHDDGQAWRQVWIAAISVQRLRQDLHRADRDTVSSAARQNEAAGERRLYGGCLSVRKTAVRLAISPQKAFRWRHKFLDFLRQQQPKALMGIVEVDETVFPVSYKGQRKGMPRASKQRPGKTQDSAGAEKTTVVVAVQRGTSFEFDHVLAHGTAVALTEALRPVLSADAVLSTDGNAAYWTVAKELGVASGSFIAAYHGHGGDGVWHVQSVNRYDSSLKTWMTRFRGVATKYLANYLGWRRLLDRFKDNLTPQQFLFHALRTAYL